jgi:hypothetical protein
MQYKLLSGFGIQHNACQYAVVMENCRGKLTVGELRLQKIMHASKLFVVPWRVMSYEHGEGIGLCLARPRLYGRAERRALLNRMICVSGDIPLVSSLIGHSVQSATKLG